MFGAQHSGGAVSLVSKAGRITYCAAERRPVKVERQRFVLTSPHNSHMREAVPFLVTFKHVTGADVRAERFVSSAASATFPPRTVCLPQ
jgi:hypothetical protein